MQGSTPGMLQLICLHLNGSTAYLAVVKIHVGKSFDGTGLTNVKYQFSLLLLLCHYYVYLKYGSHVNTFLK